MESLAYPSTHVPAHLRFVSYHLWLALHSFPKRIDNIKIYRSILAIHTMVCQLVIPGCIPVFCTSFPFLFYLVICLTYDHEDNVNDSADVLGRLPRTYRPTQFNVLIRGNNAGRNGNIQLLLCQFFIRRPHTRRIPAGSVLSYHRPDRFSLSSLVPYI